MAENNLPSSVLLPALVGAGGGLAYVKTYTGPKLDPLSFMIGGSAIGLGVAVATSEFVPARNLALATALFGIVVYDRWHDQMWPFASAQGHTA